MKVSLSSILIAACLCMPAAYAQDTETPAMVPAAASTPAAEPAAVPAPANPTTNVDVNIDAAPAPAAAPPSQTTIHVDAPAAAPVVTMPSTNSSTTVKETSTNNRVVTQAPAERNDSNYGLMFVGAILALGVIAFVVSKTASKTV